MITLYKLHNKLSCESSSSCRVCGAVLFDKLDTAKMHGLDTSNVSSRVVLRRDEPSGIWAIVVTNYRTNPRITHWSTLWVMLGLWVSPWLWPLTKSHFHHYDFRKLYYLLAYVLQMDNQQYMTIWLRDHMCVKWIFTALWPQRLR